VFGTLMGVATVASLVALGMNLDVKLPATTDAPSATSSSQEAQPAPEPAPPPTKPKRARTKLPGPWRISDAKGDARLKIVEDRVGTDPFLKALQRAGVELREAYRVITSMKGVRDFDKCKASDRFVVLIERGSSKVKAFEYIANPEEVYQSREGEDSLLKGSKLDLKVERNQFVGALVYDGKSFDASAEQGGFERGLAKAVSKALDGHMALDELERVSLEDRRALLAEPPQRFLEPGAARARELPAADFGDVEREAVDRDEVAGVAAHCADQRGAVVAPDLDVALVRREQ
jgi:hypothetical protein